MLFLLSEAPSYGTADVLAVSLAQSHPEERKGVFGFKLQGTFEKLYTVLKDPRDSVHSKLSRGSRRGRDVLRA